jgi:hypothetical protein
LFSDYEEGKSEYIYRTTKFSVSKLQYNTARMIILLLMLVNMATSSTPGEDSILKNLAVLGVVWVISIPRRKILKRKTPFGYILDIFEKEDRQKKDVEVFRAITQLKNLAISQKDKPLGADFMIEQLSRFAVITKPIFSQTISLWRMGKEDEACDYFADEIDTKLGREFANILRELDEINPVELVDQLELFQNHIKEERVTNRLKKQEMISNILFMPIVATAFVIMLNFVVIVVWMDALSSISTI